RVSPTPPACRSGRTTRPCRGFERKRPLHVPRSRGSAALPARCGKCPPVWDPAPTAPRIAKRECQGARTPGGGGRILWSVSCGNLLHGNAGVRLEPAARIRHPALHFTYARVAVQHAVVAGR